jgi:PAS domain S-box-containing protein
MDQVADVTGDRPPAAVGLKRGPVAVLTGALSAVLGFVVLLGWHLGNAGLIQVHQGLSPMAYNTAASFVGLGLALLMLGMGWRIGARVAAGVCSLPALATVVQYMAEAPWHVDAILVRITLPSATVINAPMAPNTAIGFVLIAVAILLCSAAQNFRSRLTAIALCGSASAAMGLNAFAGYLTGLQTYAWGGFEAMAVHTSAGLVLLGAGTTIFSWRELVRLQADRRAWISTMIAMAGSVTSISLWQALSSVEKLQTESALRLQSGLSGVIMVLGLLLTGLLGAAVYLAQTARFRTRLAEHLRENAQKESAERKLALEALSASERKYRTLLENLAQKIAYKDRNSTYLSCNENFARDLGIRPFEIAGKTDYDFFPKELAEKYRGDDRRVMESGKVSEIEEDYVRDGQIQSVQTVKSPVQDEAGKVNGVIVIFWDVTERKRAEEAARASDALLRNVIDSSADYIYVKDRDLRTVLCNQAFATALGKTVAEVCGKTPIENEWDPELIQGKGWVSDDQAALRGETVHVGSEPCNVGPATRFFDTIKSPVRDARGEIIGLVGVSRDVTERQKIEAARQESEAAFRTLTDAMPQIVWICIPDGLNVYFNQRWVDYTGLTLEESYGRGWNTPFHPDDKQAAWNAWTRATQSGEPYSAECRVRAAEGSYRWFLMRGVPLRDAAGQIIKWFGTCTDIDDVKRAEEGLRELNKELRQASAYTRSLIEASLDPLVTIAPDGKITDLNRATELVTGGSREELIGADFSNYFTDPERARHGYQQAFGEGSVRDYELEIRRRDGLITPVRYNASVYRNEAGAVVGVFAAARDISERKRAEEALDQSIKELARSNAELEQFAYVASHDLKEPLRMVANFTQLLSQRYRDQLGQEGAEFIAYAVDGANRMQRLIDDLLTFSRVGTRGKSFEPTDCNQVFAQSLANLQFAIGESGALVDHDEFPTVLGDSLQLVQLFQNLVGNAIKFHSEAPPRVHVSVERKDSQWVFSVQDNGIGIDPQFADRIFVIFQRLHYRGEYPGTGIGLALCKKIVERHKGRIWVESEPGKGATFFFSIPIKSAT